MQLRNFRVLQRDCSKCKEPAANKERRGIQALRRPETKHTATRQDSPEISATFASCVLRNNRLLHCEFLCAKQSAVWKSNSDQRMLASFWVSFGELCKLDFATLSSSSERFLQTTGLRKSQAIETSLSFGALSFELAICNCRVKLERPNVTAKVANQCAKLAFGAEVASSSRARAQQAACNQRKRRELNQRALSLCRVLISCCSNRQQKSLLHFESE